MRRDARLQSAAKWITTYPGKNIVRGYAHWYAVDLVCAITELRLLGVPVAADYEAHVRRSIAELANTRARLRAARVTAKMLPPEADPQAWSIEWIESLQPDLDAIVTTGVRRYQFNRDHRNPGPTSTEAERSRSRTHVAHGIRREPPGRYIRAPNPAPGSAWADRASIGSAQSQEGPFSVEERRASMTRPPTSERPRGFTSFTLPVGEEPRRRHRVGPWSPVTSVVLVPTLTGGDTPFPSDVGPTFGPTFRLKHDTP
ncbi:MAG: hypothetical protein H0T89_31565 [Deltaproteobacteria bacterium]|nr:hypothetical protein [Deltaproteobacteria bacterium]